MARASVLLVDDTACIREVLSDLLREADCDVVEASSAEEALQALSAGVAPSFALVDVQLPGMSGDELRREVQARWPERRFPFAFMSGTHHDAPPDAPFIRKPFDLYVITAQFEQLIAAGRAA